MSIREIKKAVFVESNVRHIPNENLLEHFIVSIDNERTRIYLKRHYVDPLSGKATGPRDISDEQALIESLNPGDLVDLTVQGHKWTIGYRQGTKYYLIHATRS